MTEMHDELFISVDVETSGPYPGSYSLLSIGACVAQEPSQTFYIELKPISKHYDEKALEVTGFSLEALEQTGIAPKAAMEAFSHWITEVSGEAPSVFVGLNAPFDWAFVNHYFLKFLGRNPFGFAALDIKALFMGMTGCSWRDTRSSQINKILKPSSRGNHDALRDATAQAELFELIMDRIRKKKFANID